MPGACNTDGVVYQATVKNSLGGQATYVGLAQNFKDRFRKHRKNLTKKCRRKNYPVHPFLEGKGGGEEPHSGVEIFGEKHTLI